MCYRHPCVYGLDIGATIEYYVPHRRLATVTAVRLIAPFGALDLHGDTVTAFVEQPTDVGGLIRGGFFVLSPRAMDIVAGDDVYWEDAMLRTLAREGQLQAHHHDGFWQPMDTVGDRNHLERLWQTGAPRRKWK